MADRSEEETVEKSTDELLAETDSLLSDVEGGEREGSKRDSESAARTSADENFDLGPSDGTQQSQPPKTSDANADDGEGLRRFFNPRSFLLAGALLLVGFVAGSFVPLGIVGQFVGMVGAAFVYGLGTSKGRYAETGLAGAGIAVASAFLTNVQFAFIRGGNGFFAFMAAIGLVAGLLGYYFGSDLRKGITSDPDGDDFEDDLSW